MAPRHPLPLSVAYHDACHLAHAQGVRAQPRRLLDIPGPSLREIASAEICCGSAGVWNVLNPEPARELGGLAHTVQVLDASIRGLPAQSLLHS